MGRVGTAVLGVMLSLAGVAASAPARADCEMNRVASLKVLRWNNLPFVEGSLNGHGIRILIDTSAQTSVIWGPYAPALEVETAPVGKEPAAGQPDQRLRLGKIRELRIGTMPVAVSELPVLGQGDRPFALLLGQDVLAQLDVEFDLPYGQITLFRPQGCEGKSLAYWPGTYGTAALTDGGPDDKAVRFQAALNGSPVAARLESGAIYSMATRAAATATGAKTDGPDLAKAGPELGLDAQGQPRPAVTFDSLTVAGETFKAPKLILAEGRPGNEGSEVVLGGDFLQTHRVLVSNSQKKLYVTAIATSRPAFQLEAPADDNAAQAQQMQKAMQDALGKQYRADSPAALAASMPNPLLGP